MNIIKKEKYLGEIIFFFLKQSNDEYEIAVNPGYLKYYRFVKGLTPPEIEAAKNLDDTTWRRLLAQLKILTIEEKKDLLKREWAKSHLAEYDIPLSVEKRFFQVLNNNKIILNK